MHIAYTEWNPRPHTQALVSAADTIIEEYQLAGYTLTLRQLYYQFVARDLIPNTDRSYKNLVNVITKARMAGLISWESIEDRNRTHNAPWIQEDIMDPLESLPYYIRYDQWARQDYYIEVWVEKEALGNVVSRACDPLLVPHMACKGYLSSSEAWRAGRRFLEKIQQGKECLLLHLGDHDPSGIDMTRDNRDRLDLFSVAHGVRVHRLALNRDQIDEHNPPPNPTKVTDSRAKGYIREHGHTSWELDALAPHLIESMIKREIKRHIDFSIWDEVNDRQTEVRELLGNVHDRWDQILPLLED